VALAPRDFDIDQRIAVVKNAAFSPIQLLPRGVDVAAPISANRVGLVVVHGIGDPSPGEALRDLTDAMEADGIASFDAAVLERRLPDVRASEHKLKFFPVHLRTGVLKQVAQSELIAAEVFWGSASQLAPGKWGVLQGTVSLLLNVPTLVMGARGEKSVVSVLSWWASMLLASAAFALNALLILTLGVYIGLCYVFGAPPTKWEIVAPIAAAGVTFWLSRSSWLWFKEACLAFRFVGLVCLLPWLFTGRTLQDFAKVSVPILGFTIVAVALMVLVVGVVFVAQRFANRLAEGSVTATLARCLQFGLWTLIVPLAWQGLFALIPDGGEQRWMIDAFGSAAASNGLQWLLALVVMLAFGCVRALRWVQARAAQRQIDASAAALEAAVNARPADRLILHPVLAVALFACVMVGAAVIVLGAIRPEWIRPLQAFAGQFGNAKVAGAALVLVPLLATQLRLALDLAYDVMFYLYYATEPGRRILSRTRGTTRSNNPMLTRFHSVVEHLVCDQHVAQLIILAHSQGTVIALDELTHSWNIRHEKLPPISLVTFGSPISQLYQHYFPHFYPDWKSAQWTVFFSRLYEWNNFYRLDDYVGTTIAPPTSFAGTFYQEAVGRGGHTGYWRDPRFLAALKRQVFDISGPAARG